jgi:protein-S-isoprenylcysteine O-methyltransferase Ste14
MKIKTFILALAFGSVITAFFILAIGLNIRLGLPIFSRSLLNLLGLIFILLGVSIHLSSVYFFKFIGRGTPVPIEPPRKLVRFGLYRFTRNPMYLGIFSMILGGFFFLGHLLLLVYAFLFLIIIHLYVVFVEEPKLIERFGEDYLNYMQSVPRWIPKIK